MRNEWCCGDTPSPHVPVVPSVVWLAGNQFLLRVALHGSCCYCGRFTGSERQLKLYVKLILLSHDNYTALFAEYWSNYDDVLQQKRGNTKRLVSFEVGDVVSKNYYRWNTRPNESRVVLHACDMILRKIPKNRESTNYRTTTVPRYQYYQVLRSTCLYGTIRYRYIRPDT
jgi:hypothetical protein